MKTLGKLNINPEKVIRNEELITLNGGYGVYNYSWDCMLSPGMMIGCVSTVTDTEWVAVNYCVHWFGTTWYVEGPYAHVESCDVF